MKDIALFLLLSTLMIFQPLYAARTCEDYIKDVWQDSRYTIETISSDNVVTDNVTDLMWKQCSEGLSGADCMTGTATIHNWQQTLATPEALNTTGFAGFSDWRVPNIEELRSLAAVNCFNPAINEIAFPNMLPNEFWSSSPVVHDNSSAWTVQFNKGKVSYTNRNSSNHVRLVRSIQ